MKYIRKHIKLITILTIILIISSLIVLKVYLNKNSKTKVKEEIPDEIIITEVEEKLEAQTEEPQEIIEFIYVDIKGAVINPGVYEIEKNKKVIDVVNKAGGLTKEADTSMINLAKQVEPEMVIIIYTKEEVKKYQTKEEIIKVIDKECICPEITNDACINNSSNNDSNVSSNDNKKPDIDQNEKININTASLEELQNLNGIGEGKAKSIIEYREEHGKFNSIEELKEVSGIGESVYEKIKDNITI